MFLCCFLPFLPCRTPIVPLISPCSFSSAAVDLIRALIERKDDFYNRYFVRYQLAAPLMETYFQNPQANNLINSSILDVLQSVVRVSRCCVLGSLPGLDPSASALHCTQFRSLVHPLLSSYLYSPSPPFFSFPSTSFVVSSFSFSSSVFCHVVLLSSPFFLLRAAPRLWSSTS